jgi:hypothetical protein
MLLLDMAKGAVSAVSLVRMPTRDERANMAYWWVSQNTNYSVVINQGTLWTLPTRDGQLPLSRLLIKDTGVEDIALHYRGPFCGQ